MRYELVYDAVTTSETPRNVLMFALVALCVTLGWGSWLRLREKPLTMGWKFSLAVTTILGAVYVLNLVEQRVIARRPTQTVEGAIVGLWQQANRTKRADGKYSTTHWEGFWINGIAFVYATDVDQNYFHNGGSRAVTLHDGMRVRLRYQVVSGSNEIRRFERVVD